MTTLSTVTRHTQHRQKKSSAFIYLQDFVLYGNPTTDFHMIKHTALSLFPLSRPLFKSLRLFSEEILSTRMTLF